MSTQIVNSGAEIVISPEMTAEEERLEEERLKELAKKDEMEFMKQLELAKK